MFVLHINVAMVVQKQASVCWFSVGSEEWGVGSGEWGVGSGEWGVGSGEWGGWSGEWGKRNENFQYAIRSISFILVVIPL